MTRIKSCLTGVALLAVLAPTSLAQSTAKSTAKRAAQHTLVVENFVGRLDIQTGPNEALDVSLQNQADSVSFEKTAFRLTVDGAIRKPDGNKCRGYYGKLSWLTKRSHKVSEVGGYEELKEYPKLTVTAPDDVHLILRNSIVFGTAGHIGSLDVKDQYCSKFSMGNVARQATLDVRGSGDFSGLDTGDLTIEISGSGDVTFQNSNRVKLDVMGSGDVSLKNVLDTRIDLKGSGDVDIETIAGDLSVSTRGSGDVEIGDTVGDVKLSSVGSSDIELDSINGNLDISSRGSSFISIDGGSAPHVSIHVMGSGTVDFDGTANTAELIASGSGDIYVGAVTDERNIRESGSADIEIGD